MDICQGCASLSLVVRAYDVRALCLYQQQLYDRVLPPPDASAGCIYQSVCEMIESIRGLVVDQVPLA